jgi:metallophosphoesterase (TIGR00282 family)
MNVRLLAVGDVVGRPGRTIILHRLPELCRRERIDCVIVNGENLAGGSGLMPAEADELFRCGVSVITGGDHIWGKKEIVPYIDREPRLIRPANYAAGQPGKGHVVVQTASGVKVGVLHLQGRVFMNIPCDCPFLTAQARVKELREQTPVIAVDMHGEATSEKVAMGWWLDGHVSLVYGTHTHIQTADDRILPQGTAYITDCGMTGPYESVIGRRVDRVLHRFTTGMPAHFEVAAGDVRLCGVLATVDAGSGRAVEIRRVTVREDGSVRIAEPN